MLGRPLCERFDLVFGTSTGAIIAALISLGYGVDAIHDLYREHVPTIMSCRRRKTRTAALEKLTHEVFGKHSFADFRTGIGIVTARWLTERPMIFKSRIEQAHGARGSFIPGFGVPLADAIQASCSAYPFFERKIVKTADGDLVELLDGGFCANNPTLYAISDAVAAFGRTHSEINVVSIGVGEYPAPKNILVWLAKKFPFNSIELLQKTLEINTQSMDELRGLLFKDVATVRISDRFTHPAMATDLLEHNLEKLNILRQRGRESFRPREDQLRQLLM
jgi:patatin-like phospholipase/acyl hydrolase